MTDCRLRLETLRHRAMAQQDVLASLGETFAQEAEHLHRYDQAQRLDALKERMAREVSNIQSMETAASYGFTKATLISGLAKFGIGSLIAVVRHSREHPLSVGARWAQGDFERTAPFGTVLVAVGPGGVPDDVNVIALSREARKLERTESEVVAALKARGHYVMTPESFFTALDELREKVLKGNLALPVAASSFLRKNRRPTIRPAPTEIKLVEERITESPGQDGRH